MTQPKPSRRYIASRRARLLLVFIVFVTAATVFYVKKVRPITVYWSLVNTVSDEILSFSQKRPANVDAKQWEEAVGWTMNIYGNVSMMTDECDMPFLQRFRTSLQKKANRGVDFDTLKWIWDELAKAGPRAADYAYSYRPVHLMAFEPITDETLPKLWGIDDCRILDLSGSRISDQGLVHLKTLSKVKFIHLNRTNVTQESVYDLQKALPNCRVMDSRLYYTLNAIGRLGEAVKLYSVDHNGRYPVGTAEEVRRALVESGFLEKQPGFASEWPSDDWGTPLKYEYPTSKPTDGEPAIWSLGPDNQSGTNDDIRGW